MEHDLGGGNGLLAVLQARGGKQVHTPLPIAGGDAQAPGSRRLAIYYLGPVSPTSFRWCFVDQLLIFGKLRDKGGEQYRYVRRGALQVFEPGWSLHRWPALRYPRTPSKFQLHRSNVVSLFRSVVIIEQGTCADASHSLLSQRGLALSGRTWRRRDSAHRGGLVA